MALVAQADDYAAGSTLFEQGRFADAVPYLLRATQAAPSDAKAWKALGVAYASQKLYRQAEQALARACKLNPKLAEACYFHGRALYGLDRFDDSRRVLAAAARLEPDSWLIELGIAQCAEALGAADAEGRYRRAVRLARGRDPRPGVALGLFLIRQGRAGDAAPGLRGVAKSFPESAEARLQLGRALLEAGEEAVSELENAVALGPESAQAHLLLAKAYTRAGRVSEAKAHFDEAARLQAQ